MWEAQAKSMVAKSRMTVAEFEAIAEQLGPCELVRGEVEYLSPAGLPHGFITVNVATLLSGWARRSRRGRVFGGEVGIVTEAAPGTVRGADVAYFSYRRLPKKSEPRGFARVPPELVVEVLGAGHTWRMLVEKAGEYLRMGVDRVWIIDSRTRRVHILRPDDEPLVLGEKDTITDAKVLPGFRCRVREFFR
jgi:Uma2 family endonuclease